MDDKKNEQGNQPQSDLNSPIPIFEAADNPPSSTPPENEMQPEEIPEDMDVNKDQPPSEEPPPIYEENKTKYLIVVGAAIIFILIFIFIFRLLLGGSRTSLKEVNLTYWGLWEGQETLDPLIKDYQQKNPTVKIKYEKMSHQDYLQKLLVRSKEGLGPDIFRFHNTWLPLLKEIVSPLPESIMDGAEFEKTFYPVHTADLKVGSRYYGLPLEIDGLILITNTSLLKKAGIASAPNNWDQLLDNAATLTVKDTTGQIITSGIALGTASNVEFFSDIFGWMLLQNGGDLKNLNQKEAADILASYRQFAEPPNNFWDENMPNSINAFIQEKVAMIIAPSWVILNIKTANPDLQLKTAPLPSVPGAKAVGLASYWVEGVSRYSESQIEAWKFLRFLTEKDNQTKLYENESKSRLFGEPYARVDLGSTIVQNEYIGAVIQQANNYRSLPMASKTYDNSLNDEIIKYVENAINASANGISYDQSVKTAAEGVNQVFNKYQIE